MDEYISKSIAVEELENLRQQYNMHDDCDELVASKCKNAVSELPAADVAPVVHAEWIDSPDKLIKMCSYCKADWGVFDNETYRFEFCPNCGAKMYL